jgi:hypothetical protein
MPLFQKMDDKILHIEENNTKSFIEAENTKLVWASLMTFN